MKLILFLIPILPLTGVLVNLTLTVIRLKAERSESGRSDILQKATGVIASAVVGISFVLSVFVFIMVAQGHRYNIDYYTWFSAADLTVSFGFLADSLSAVMMLVVTGVGFIIHVYSIGYMSEDADRQRFFIYMNLFIFSMLILVMANNLALMFLGWEGVGLCSYLLISFWYHKPSAASAGTKAFIVNRIGDAGFLIALFLIFTTFGTLHYDALFEAISNYPNIILIGATMTGIGMLLFIGAAGKSAQVPLYVWLPDAMEGPTPVSALIHAATMVTAGVFMAARCYPFFSFDVGPIGYVLGMSAGELVMYTGIITALFAATIAMVQNDIKRIIAYSTISQLGYMFVGVGVGAYAAGIFHLFTHAFFKALLFLAAGSVIHAMMHAFRHTGTDGDPQDIRNMGGLYKKLSITAMTFIVGWIAISGIPPFSGFFSKDEILTAAYHNGYKSTYWFGVLGALMTAFYMSRLAFVVFFKPASKPELESHLHESPKVMTVPLMILAAFSAFAGLLNVPEFLNGHQWFSAFLSSSVGGGLTAPHHGANEWVLAGFVLTASLAGIVIAAIMYFTKKMNPEKMAADYKPLYRLWLNKYFVDDFYGKYLIRPLQWFSEKIFWKGLDRKAIDGTINVTASAIDLTGRILRIFQSGYVQTYGFFMLIGIVIILYYLFN